MKGTAHMWRFAQLLAGDPMNSKRFAGRDNHYASFGTADYARRLTKFIAGKSEDAQGRGAIALRPRDQTIEVRMFRGSLNPDRLLANLEFVNAACEYTRAMTVKQVREGALAWMPLVVWVKEHEKEYPHLNEYLTRQFITRKPIQEPLAS